jgi:hypothetical protein
MSNAYGNQPGGGAYVARGSGCTGGVVAINLVFGLTMLAAAAVMVVQGLSSGNMNLALGGGIGCGVGGLACLLVAIGFWMGAARKRRLLTSGVPGQAQVVGLGQTGMYLNNQPVVEMRLQITTAMRPPYVVTCSEGCRSHFSAPPSTSILT